MILEEIGSPFEFGFKELLSGCKKMINDDYPDNVFLFRGDNCYFQIDYKKKIFWLSCKDIEQMSKDNDLNHYQLMEVMDRVINEKGNQEKFEIMCWGEINNSFLKIEISKGNFKPL